MLPSAGMLWHLYGVRNMGNPNLEGLCVLECAGLDFFSPEPFVPGERLRCSLNVGSRETKDNETYLTCDLEVVRVMLESSGRGFWLTCRLCEYSILEGMRKAPTTR